eukprot:1294818-Rhodomonas_salina.1
MAGFERISSSPSTSRIAAFSSAAFSTLVGPWWITCSDAVATLGMWRWPSASARKVSDQIVSGSRGLVSGSIQRTELRCRIAVRSPFAVVSFIIPVINVWDSGFHVS